MKFVKIFLLVFILGNIFLIAPVKAEDKVPELNPLCWRKEDCSKIRKSLGVKDLDIEKGFVSDGPCQGDWVKCLPAGKTTANISLGGKKEFAHIGDYILTAYKYGVTVAAIIAVVVIILAGVQWITSGGNSDGIGKAKKRIGGAVIGLFIAYLSFFVLNTINPALVNLRLPQVYLLKPMDMMPEFCADLDPTGERNIKFMLGADSTESAQKKQITPETADGKNDGFKWKYVDDPKLFWCGKRFFAENGGNATCSGAYCNTDETCYKDDKNYSNCIKGQLIVKLRVDMSILADATELAKYTLSDWLGELEDPDWLKNDAAMFWGVCRQKSDPSHIFLTKQLSGIQTTKNELTGAMDGPYGRYTFAYSGVTNAIMSACNELYSGDSQPVGALMRYRIDEDNDSDEPTLNIGFRAGKAVWGHFTKDLTIDDFIPYEKLSSPGGAQLSVEFNITTMNHRLEEDENNNPESHYLIGGSQVGPAEDEPSYSDTPSY